MRLLAVLASALLLQACGSVRNDPPTATQTVSKQLDAVANCLISALNEHHKPMAWDKVITYHVQIISPGMVYEIMPQQIITVGKDPWFIRASRQPNGTTRLEAFGPEFLKAAMDKCSA